MDSEMFGEASKKETPEKKDRALEFKITGSKKDVEKMIDGIKKIVKEVAPEAKIFIIKEGKE